MQRNTENFHLLLNSQGPNTINIDSLCINDSSWGKLLGQIFYSYLTFEKHVNGLARLMLHIAITKKCSHYQNKACYN